MAHRLVYTVILVVLIVICNPERTLGHCEQRRAVQAEVECDCDPDLSSAVISGSAILTSGSTAYQSTATVNCNPGYASATTRITCQAHGFWSTAVCSQINCGSLPLSAITSGTATLTSGTTTYLSTAAVNCNTGYSSTTSMITCLSNGQWSTAVCSILDCGTDPSSAVTSGTATLTTQGTTTYLSTATVNCITGYLSATLKITCQASGQWSSAVCSILNCGNPTSISGGTASFSSTTYGSTASVSCNPGYENPSPETITCSTFGRWPSASCSRKDCGSSINTIANGRASPSAGSTKYASTATVTCDTGYKDPTPQVVNCQSDGTWSSSSCAIQDCRSPPDIYNGGVSFTETTYQAVATYTCNTGYIVSGTIHATTTTRTCTVTGAWSGQMPVCTVKDCGNDPSSAVTSGTATLTPPGSTTYQSTATVNCDAGYSSATSTITCRSSGQWSSAVCSVSNCVNDASSAVTLGTATLTTSGSTTIGSKATVNCNDGYTSTTSTITCQSSGQWSTAVCSVINCGPLPSSAVIFGYHSLPSGGSTLYQSTATVICDTGYTSTTTTITCQSDGQWSTATCSRKDCGPVPSSALISGSAYAISGITTYQSTASVICDTGYTSTTTTITCRASGQWSTAICSKKDCGTPSTPVNGRVSFELTTYQAEATYTCDAGYTVDGRASNTITITCTSVGDWSIEFPTCSVDVKPLGVACVNPANTNASASDLCDGVNALCRGKTDTSAEFTCQCDAEYYDDNGNNPNGSCKPISDLKVQTITFASISTTSMTVSWSPPADKQNCVDSYMVEWKKKDNSLQGDSSPIINITTYTLSKSLRSGRAYTVKVITRNRVSYTSTVKTAFFAKEQATKPQTPGVVIAGSSDLDAVDRAIYVTWTGSIGDVSGYEWKLLDGSTELKSGTAAISSAYINYSEIKNGYRYNISITALSQTFDNGRTIRSETHTEAIKTVVKVPSAPLVAVCHMTTDTSITIKWGASLHPNGDLIDYKIDTYELGSAIVLKTNMTGSLALTYKITGLQPGSYYYFDVSTVNEKYTSPPVRLSPSYCATRANVSAMPTNLNVSDVKSRSFMVSWNKPTNTYGENMGYIVQVQTADDSCVMELIMKCDGCTRSFNPSSLEDMCQTRVSKTEQQKKTSIDSDELQMYNVTSLNPYVNYTVTVTAVNSAGRGRIAGVIVQTDEEAPQQPKYVTISNLKPTSCNITWDIDGPIPGYTTWEVIVDAVSPVKEGSFPLTGFHQRRLALNNLQEYWNYTVTIKATTSKGSSFSDPVFFTTLQAAPGPVDSFGVITSPGGSTVQVQWKIPMLLERNSEIAKFNLTHNISSDRNMQEISLDRNADDGYLYNVELNVTPEVVYQFEVYAINVVGERGEQDVIILEAPAGTAYGARCDFYTVCLPKRAECIEGKCLCKTGIIDWKSKQCDTMPIIDYGTEDDTLVGSDVACSGPVIFQPGFTVFGATHRSVHICSNGFASLDKPFTGPKPPRNISTLGDFVILAPYYADTSKESRKVYYRYFDISNDKGNGLNREDVVNITQFVRRFGGNSDFQPAFVLFVTWTKMRPFERSLNGTSTFQLILVSDGTITFAVYIYEHGGMLWTSNLPRPAIWSGYYASANRSESSLYSFSQQALHMDKYANTKGVQGVILHRLNTQGEVAPEQVTNGIKCHRWYNTNIMKQVNVTRIPECPCDIVKLWLDPWYTELEDQPHIPDIACSTILAAGTFSPFGKTCCYNKTTGLWVQDRPFAGTVLQYHPRAFPREHQIHDIDAKTYCCNSSNFCDKYYELHPIGTCYSRSWFEIGTVWGDPHFRTLDNGSFTFNGLGEFHLLQVEKPDTQGGLFQLQARTERPLKPNNALSEATVFSAFAASDGMGASFHVQLNQNKSDFVIYGNAEDLSKKFGKQEFKYEGKRGDLTIVKRGETLTVGFPSFGISLNVSINVRMFSIVVILKEEFVGRTRGLLGNFNGNPSDDFVLPNGTHKHANMTEQEIYYYGMEWSVDSKSSVFFYSKGKGHLDYHNSSYVPRFLEDIPIEKRNYATERCGGESNVQCIFDFVFTEDEETANQTSNTDKIFREDKKEIKETIPTIEGCELKTIKLGDEVVCKLNVSNDTDTIFVDGLEGVSHTLNQNNYTLTFKIIDTKPVLISVSAHSTNGKKSPKKAIKILLCPSCSNHGVCSSSQNRLETYSSPFFKMAQCTCDTGYDGPDCDFDYDGCSSKPCSLLRTCTDLSPEEHVQRNISHVCGPCPVGYTAVDENECIDIDECDERNHRCQDKCINTEGGYECGCVKGYRLDTTNGRLCDDINECEEALHTCEHECINTNGSYECACRDGFSLDQTGPHCIQNDEDVCSQSPINCSNAEGCTIDENQTPMCFCKNGFILTDNSACEDIDECGGNICPQDCLNTIGSFQCMCHSGYRMAGKTTCVPCDYLSWGPNCSNTCDCPNANDCDTVKGCVCKKGWIGDRCDEDINECQINPNLCPDGRETCINTDGSYYCACVDGYSRPEGSTLQCTDIDECSSPRLHNCEHFCNNTIGGYTCSCQEGHIYKNVTHCEDVNECDLKTAGCQHICENFKGGYNCYCEFGYILNDDRKTCTEDENPCLTANLTCSQVCITDIESRTPSCGCEPGYIMTADNVSCSDTNECEDTILNRCGIHSNCSNEMGSFRCECQIGFKLQNDERTCQECDQFHFGEDCRNTCSCVRGNCDNEIGCICDNGWTGDNCDQDLDECQTLTAPCGGDNVYCQNIPGGYMCRCLTGFHNISGTCEDIDECIQDNTNNCDQRCENSYGSYTCLCNNGFIRKNDHCEDIDECSKQHDCSQKCDNTIGSYRCSCKTGYKLDLSSRRSCSPITECNSTMIDLCESKNANCSVIDSKPICSCWKGYEDNSTSGSCSDIDECIENPCEHTCENTDGDFSCSCYDGYKLDVDRTTCTECQPFYYGQECTQRCACNLTNTESCNNTNGICTCKEGWTSDDCSEDIDECMVGTHSCTDIINSECVNSPGSYMCTCLSGYTREASVCIDINECMDGTGDCSQECENTEGSFICKCSNGYRMDLGNCTECNDNTFGYNCSEQCTCYTNNTMHTTQSCNPSTGICHCKQEWTGSNCSVDVNECMNTDLCNDVPFSDCHNIEGGYSCECLRGYTKGSNGECTADTLSSTTTRSAPRLKEVRLQITFAVNLPEGTNLNVSATYMLYEADVLQSLKVYYGSFRIAEANIVINSLSQGSLKVDYTLVYEKSKDVDQTIGAATIRMVQGVDLVFQGENVSSYLDVPDNLTDLCDIYRDLFGQCEDGLRCKVENNEPTCSKESDDDNVTVIIIVSAVAFVLIVSLIVLVVCLKVMRGRREQKKRQNASLNDTSRRRVSLSNESARGTYARDNMSHVSAGWGHVGPFGSGNLEDQEIHNDHLKGHWHSGMGGRYIFYKPQLTTTVPTVARRDPTETRNIDEESPNNAF